MCLIPSLTIFQIVKVTLYWPGLVDEEECGVPTENCQAFMWYLEENFIKKGNVSGKWQLSGTAYHSGAPEFITGF